MATNVSDDLWRECVAWLTTCKAIPVDHKANWPEAEIRVLALTLRDGVILCNLLNTIDPNALDMKDFNRKPQMAQVCSNLFFHQCRTEKKTHRNQTFSESYLLGFFRDPFFDNNINEEREKETDDLLT